MMCNRLKAFLSVCVLQCVLRGVTTASAQDRRGLTGTYHFVATNVLGSPDPDVAIGNPLKGLMPSPAFRSPPYNTGISHALEFYYIGWKQVMKANPNVVGEAAAFNWTTVELLLSASARRMTHAVLRFYAHYPGRILEVPQYLINAGVDLRNYTEDGIADVSPYYGDPLLLQAMEQFVRAFGKKYDGDKRIGFVQAGLLGYWGEWHTHGTDFLPEHVKDLAVNWFASSFTMTLVQIRYPRMSAYAAGLGFHDDSFTYETLDGEANGGFVRSYFFWSRVVREGVNDFWRYNAMGGETRIVNQHIMFEPTYNARTFQKQDFLECVNVTHATYMLHQTAFENGQYLGEELVNARRGHARMGYNFHVSSISARKTLTDDEINLEVTITQIGIAPFYYDLQLVLQCSGMTKKKMGGVEGLIDRGASMTYLFERIPATSVCLRSISLSLESSYAYPARPIKLAQRNGTVVFSIPLPGNTTYAPTFRPTSAPTRAPITSSPTVSTATQLTLIDAINDVDIGPMTNGMIVNIFLYPGISIRADPFKSFPTRSVVFMLNETVFKLENGAPYAFNGNAGNNYYPWTPALGVHTITATPYSGSSASGTPGTVAKVTIRVVNEPPVAVPVPSPTRRPTSAPTLRPATAAPISKKPTQAPVSLAPATKPPTSRVTPAPSLSPVTKAPATDAPVTKKPTQAPLSRSPVTTAPTQRPTRTPSLSPVTEAPVTSAPVSKQPTQAPVSLSPVTKAPTQRPNPAPTMNPATNAPATGAPVSKKPTHTPISLAPVTKAPTRTPSLSPVTKAPATAAPVSRKPTQAPISPAPLTKAPTQRPTRTPSLSPTSKAPATAAPVSRKPTLAPTQRPTRAPSLSPTTKAPATGAPVSRKPTQAPLSRSPVTTAPTQRPTRAPSLSPVTKAPVTGAPLSNKPTQAPASLAPLTKAPTQRPIRAPSLSPATTAPATRAPVSKKPTEAPVSRSPVTKAPTPRPTPAPTQSPVQVPTKRPQLPPTGVPTKSPSYRPTKFPVHASTKAPTKAPVHVPTKAPTRAPVRVPTKAPVRVPTKSPVRVPTKAPVRIPTKAPSKAPVRVPTKTPVRAPTNAPVRPPTKTPVRVPTKAPVRVPTPSPARVPTKAPVRVPTKAPVRVPTKAPVRIPTKAPIQTAPVIRAPTKQPTTPSSIAIMPVQTVPIPKANVTVLNLVLIRTTNNTATAVVVQSLFNSTVLQTTTNIQGVGIQAFVSNATTSVRFVYKYNNTNNNTATWTDSEPPYTFAGVGDNDSGNGQYSILSPGTHTITATPYTHTFATGQVGITRTVSFRVG